MEKMNNRGYRAGIRCCLLLILVAGSVLADPVDILDDVSPFTEAVAEDAPESVAAGDETTEGSSKPEEAAKTAVLHVQVYQNNKPVKNARVMVTYDEMIEFERKTDRIGVAVLPNLPYGQADIDVISSGMRSGKEVILLDKPEKRLIFHLELRPVAKE